MNINTNQYRILYNIYNYAHSSLKKKQKKKLPTYNSKPVIQTQSYHLHLYQKMKTHSYPQSHDQMVSKILLPISLSRPQPWQSTAIQPLRQQLFNFPEVYHLKRFGIVSFIENFFGLVRFD